VNPRWQEKGCPLSNPKTRNTALPGLSRPEGSTPAQRRLALAQMGDEELLEQLVDWALALGQAASPVVEEWAEFTGLPVGELVASPFGLRACALGIQGGVVACHHELRADIVWDEEILPGDALDAQGGGQWDRGVLHAPKYAAFLQDGALLTYNSNHQARWTPHEMLHRAGGFFFREDASKWEIYLGARLNELLPVVHWYGFDLVARLDEFSFDREVAARTPKAPLGKACWWTEDRTQLEERMKATLVHLRSGLAHAQTELDAVAQETEHFSQVVIEHPFLNGASDAMAYAVGHQYRLDRGETHKALLAMTTVGAQRWDSIAAYQSQVETLLDRLLFEPLEVDLKRSSSCRDARIVWDVVHRASLSLDAFERVEPFLEKWGAGVRSGLEGNPFDAKELWSSLNEVLRGGEREKVLLSGLIPEGWWGESKDLVQMSQGIESALPATALYWMESGEFEEVLHLLGGADKAMERASLVARVGELIHGREIPLLSRLYHLDMAFLNVVDEDQVVASLMDPPESSLEEAGGILVASQAFHLHLLDQETFVFHATRVGGAEVDGLEGVVALLIGQFQGQVSMIPVPTSVASLWEELAISAMGVSDAAGWLDARLSADGSGWPTTSYDWLEAMVDSGALGWTPVLSPH
jgi:hypothetical protein